MNKEEVLSLIREAGKKDASSFQNKSAPMTGTEINASCGVIPFFTAALSHMNMLKRKAGFVCISPSGRVVRLLQPYDSDVYTQEPEELPAQWGFVWSQDPAHALPFVSIATSPYNTGDCCVKDGKVYRSGQDGNVWEPGTPNVKWDEADPHEDP